MIKTISIGKKFGSVYAVHNVHLEAKKGEIHGLVGPDGAGKTTLMRMICGILNPTEGEAQLTQTSLGYMPQRFSLYGDLTVIENIYFFGGMYGMDKKTLISEAEEMLKMTGLDDFKLRFADNLSGGMKQKLALTCALISKPSLLVLDEPTFGVDPEYRKEFWKILYQLNSEGLTILVSTPYMDEAELCHRVSFMDNGKIISCDSPGNFKKNFKYEVLELYLAHKYLLPELEEIFDAEIYGDKYRLLVPKAPDINERIHQKLHEHGIRDIHIKTAKPNMEDVYISLAEGGHSHWNT